MVVIFESHPRTLFHNAEIALIHLSTRVKLAQIKIVAADETVEKFKRIVLTSTVSSS